jgi:hypothetical protein
VNPILISSCLILKYHYTHACPIITLAPPEVGAGRPPPNALGAALLADAAAGVGPTWKGEAPRGTGAERRRTFMGRWSRRTSVKNLAYSHVSIWEKMVSWVCTSSPHGSDELVSPSLEALDALGDFAPATT